MLISLAVTIILARGCLCVVRKFLSNFGCPDFNVRSYLMLSLSNALATLIAAQMSTSMPVSSLICFNIFFSRMIRFFLIESAFSRSTLTPSHFMSMRQGRSRVSRSKMLLSSCLINSGLKYCHSRSVRSASCSA